MLVSQYGCNRHSPFLHSKILINPLFQIPNCYPSIVQFKPRRRRASVSAAALPQSAIRRIAEKLRSLGYVEESSTGSLDEASMAGRNSPGEIFVPLPTRLPNYRVGHTLDPSWSTPHNPVPDPGWGNAIQRFHELRRGVLEEEEKERIRKRNEGKKEKAPTLAELTLPKEELTRLTTIGIGLKKKIKVGKAGITEGIVNGIHERWRRSELVKIACDDICRLNMKRTHELLERKTGGLVVWRSGGIIILYRGSNYKYPYFLTDELQNEFSSGESSDVDNNQGTLSEVPSPVINAAEYSEPNSDIHMAKRSLVQGAGVPNRVRFQLPGEVQLAEEADALLEGLGPRFSDWWGYDPLPVDADLLPAVVPGYRAPFRLLPYGVQPKLTNDEMTTLRRLGRPLPCHFALGRNRKLQGLAAAIVKLWEKCEIAKIAVKRGVQNTNSLLMAEELKRWTGGTLLSRDKEFIVFYRGKDFLPGAVSSAIEERRKFGMAMSESRTSNLKEHEYGAREHDTDDGTDEFNDKKLRGNSDERKMRISEAAIARTSTKLSLAIAKKAKAEKLLAKLQEEETPQEPEMDKEGITEEERHMLRRVGLRMKPFLLLGRRGVFDGTVENMHLHWKYRELVKVCVGQRRIEEIHGIARTLEAESGGILVAIERLSKGFAIIVYRGKNYKRPASLRPRTLLSKRAAMKRALEAQRRKSLKLHVLKLSSDIDELKLKMAKDEDRHSTQLSEDQEQGFADQEVNKNHDNDDKLSHKDPEIDYDSLPGECPNEAIESRGIDDTSNKPEVSVRILKDSVPLARQELPGDAALGHAVKGNYLFDSTETEIQLGLQPKGTEGFQNLSEQSENAEPPYNFMTQDQTRSSTVTYHQTQTGYKDSNVGGSRNTEVEPFHAQKGMDEKSPAMPFRGSQLSNRERLILRKQALQMKKPPVLAVGKSNVITGIAKVIKAHFEKHPLAIVNIKGRAKGTSAQEVIYNLEQATGAVLVSQEPSKVILYRGWGSGKESGDASGKANKGMQNDSDGVQVKARPFISPELISAIRDECGLNFVKDENIPSEPTTADSSTDDNPNGQ